ncbi:hypothetical protein, partial [Salmonella sp. s51228]|uniref:hypothetical protein n=1 Tax=Salmonella sp. s51228 TaxID=3159652 RepID=UPI0039817F11
MLKSNPNDNDPNRERSRTIRMLYYSEEKFIAQLKIMMQYYIPALSRLTHPEFTDLTEELQEFSRIRDLSKLCLEHSNRVLQAGI